MEIHCIRRLRRPERYHSPCKCELFTRSVKSLRAVTVQSFFKKALAFLKKTPERWRSGFRCKLLFCVHGAHLAILAQALELDLAVNQSEQRIVLADTDVVARMDVRASLANENVASQNELTVCALGAEALGLGITTVLGRAAAFLCARRTGNSS